MMNHINSVKYNVHFNNNFADLACRISDTTPSYEGFHYHDGCEIMQIWSDNGYVLVEDKIYPMKIGNLYIVNALESHCTNPNHEMPYVRSKITFSTSYIRGILSHMDHLQLLNPFIKNDLYFTHMILPDEAMMIHFDKLFNKINTEFSSHKTGYNVCISNCLIEMLVLITRWFEKNNHNNNQSNVLVNPYVRSSIEYINSHLTEEIDIMIICQYLHISKYYLCHIFKEITGITVMEYITERRISMAKLNLLNSDSPVSNIVVDCGFSNFSFFSKTFKKLVGFTPLEYRKRFKM